MYCQCSHCQTLFGVSAEQLRVGRGKVRCGQCLQVFDALETLSEGTVALDGTTADDGPGLGTLPESPRAGVTVAGSSGDEVELDAAVGRIVPGEEDELITADGLDPGEPSVAKRAARTALGDTDPPLAMAGPTPAPASDAKASPSRERDERMVPEVLREDLARQAGRQRARRAVIGFGIGSCLMVVALLAQVAWFQPGEVLARYPQTRPWLEMMCERTGCVLPDRRDPARVRMTARDVRVHPRYEGALRVSASLVNTAPYAQPFPRLNFTLFNVNGQIIASRVFMPQEYLPGEIDPASEMLPRQPVQIALELLAPEDAAVSFEFGFL